MKTWKKLNLKFEGLSFHLSTNLKWWSSAEDKAPLVIYRADFFVKISLGEILDTYQGKNEPCSKAHWIGRMSG